MVDVGRIHGRVIELSGNLLRLYVDRFYINPLRAPVSQRITTGKTTSTLAGEAEPGIP